MTTVWKLRLVSLLAVAQPLSSTAEARIIMRRLPKGRGSLTLDRMLLRISSFLPWNLGALVIVVTAHCQVTQQPSSPMKASSSPNRLAQEKSPYLLQHQYNPVDWYPWGPEAFEKAKKENKTIFLSIGYSTRHQTPIQTGVLVSRGPGDMQKGKKGKQADLPLDRVFDLSLVPCDGA